MVKKISLILVLVTFLCSAVMVQAADAPDAKTLKKIVKLMKSGEKCFKKGDSAGAMEAYNKVKEMSDAYAPVYSAIANINLKDKNYDDAIANFKNALKIDPTLKPAAETLKKVLLFMGQNMMKEQQFEKANQYFSDAIALPDLDPKVAIDVTFQVAINYTMLRDNDKAVENFQKILAIPDIATLDKKKYVNSLYQVASSLYQTKKFAESEKHFLQLLAVEGLKTEFLQVYNFAHYLLGMVYHQQSPAQPENAKKHLLEYIALTQNNPQDPYAPFANYVVGTINFDTLQNKVLEIEKDKNNKNRFQQIAELAKADQTIVPFFQKVIELKDEKLIEDAQVKIGNYYYMCREFDKAIEIYNTLIANHPTSEDIETYKTFLKDIEEAKKKK